MQVYIPLRLFCGKFDLFEESIELYRGYTEQAINKRVIDGRDKSRNAFMYSIMHIEIQDLYGLLFDSKELIDYLVKNYEEIRKTSS